MKKNLMCRLMAIFTLAFVFTPNTVDAFSFGHFFKKASKFVQKAAHSPIGQMALQVGGAAVTAEAGPEAGALFEGAATSMHLADQADAQGDYYDEQAQQAEDDGDSDLADQHRATAQMHRKNAENHRENHQRQKEEYERHHGRSFDRDYKKHVARHINRHAKKMYPEHFRGDDDDEGDDDYEDEDDDDEGNDDYEDEDDDDDDY